MARCVKMPKMKPLHVVTYEDRPSDYVGLKLLVLTLAEQCPRLTLEAFCPNPTRELAQWLEKQPCVTLRVQGVPHLDGFNIKPVLLKRALEAGAAKRLLWMDTDIVVSRDFRPKFLKLESNVFVATEDPICATHQGRYWRADGWGLPRGRDLGVTVNSGVLSVTRHHLPLLDAWIDLLTGKTYQNNLKLQASERPLHMRTDQDLLNACLESAPFANLPLYLFRRGSEIVQAYHGIGYPPHEIIRNILTRTTPYFLHSLGDKPWHLNSPHRLLLDTSPYTLYALRHREQLDEPTPWMEPQRSATRLIRRIVRNSPWIGPLPATIRKDLRTQRLLHSLFRRITGKP